METTGRLRNITGVILAGGKSSRFGANKALADFGGVPLIERVLRVLEDLFENSIIITNSPREYSYLGIPAFEDIIKGLGPLGGIYSGLSALRTPWAFIVACDMPFLEKALIRLMVSLRGNYDAVVPRVDWKIEPLHALYSSRCLHHVEKMIQEHSFQIIRLFERVAIRYLEAPEIRSCDPDFRSFININRPLDMGLIPGNTKR